MIDFYHNAYALDIAYAFYIMQTVALFSLKYWKSLEEKC